MRITLAALLSLSVIAVAATLSASAASYTNLPRVIAHRTGGQPENTVTGARVGLQHSSFLETDVRFSSDGVPVLHHDASLERLTNGTGSVESKTWAQLSTLKMENGQRLNNLGELLRQVVVPNPDVTLMIEVKDQTPSAAQIARLWRDISVFKVGSRVIIASFSLENIKKMKASRHPAGVRWALNDSGSLVAPSIVDAVCGFYVVKSTDVTQSQVAAYRKQGLYVIIYTANTETAMKRAISLHPNGVLTDYPSELAAQKAMY